jgi:hypothetical protein
LSCPKCGENLEWEKGIETTYNPEGKPVETKEVTGPFVSCKNGHRYGFDPRQGGLVEIVEDDEQEAAS